VNRHSKHVVLDDLLPPGHVTRRMRTANFAFKMTHSHSLLSITQQRINIETQNLAIGMRRWISTQI